MIITNKLNLDLQKPGTVPTINTVQNDSYSRNLEITLFADRRPFVFPEQGRVVIRYKKSDGKGGEYDTLPDGRCAWQAEKNLLTIALAPQVLTMPGSVSLSVTLIDGETQLSVFPIRLAVQPIAAAKVAESEDYFYVTGLLPAPVVGQVGQCLRISGVNDVGRVTAVEALDPEALFGELISREVTLALEAAKISGDFDGDTPQKGIDYWTETDQEDIVNDVLAALGTPVFGSVDEDNNIILTGELPDGTYTLKYEDGEGNLTQIGTLTHNRVTNLADPTSEEWITGYRINSSGVLVENADHVLMNFIPCQVGDVIRVKGLNIGINGSGGSRAIECFYAEDKTTLIAQQNALAIDTAHTETNAGWTEDRANALWTHTVGASNYTIKNGTISDIRYFRFGGQLYEGYTQSDIIVTVNREIQ